VGPSAETAIGDFVGRAERTSRAAYSEAVGDREFDPFNKAGAGGNPPRGRFWVPRKARNEYMQPTSWNGVSFKSALIVVTLFVAILVAVYVVFT
jgi:hypothetical protein